MWGFRGSVAMAIVTASSHGGTSRRSCVGTAGCGLVLLLIFSFAASGVALITNTTVKDCSNTCESKHCSDPFNLRYGKYCGIGYTGCAGAVPCDGLDLCCKTHDNCIGSNLANYLNRTCNENLRNCATSFKNSGNATFSGATCSASDVEGVIITVMDLVTGTTSASSPLLIFTAQWIVAIAFGFQGLVLLLNQ